MNSRLKALVTGVVYWGDPESGDVVEREKLGWRDRWSIFGVHSRNWKWVRVWGERDCGCTINPITRRKVLIRMTCAKHGRPDWASDWLELGDDD